MIWREDNPAQNGVQDTTIYQVAANLFFNNKIVENLAGCALNNYHFFEQKLLSKFNLAHRFEKFNYQKNFSVVIKSQSSQFLTTKLNFMALFAGRVCENNQGIRNGIAKG